MTYDKTEMNDFVQSLYDQKMQEGKHGHYETMFHVVHKAIERAAGQRASKPLTDGEIYTAYITATNQTLRPQDERLALAFARAIEAAHGITGEEV